MKNTLLQRLILKIARIPKCTGGFTLLELLVSMIMATIIIGTLLTFVVNILETNRKEEAKVATQEELQAALNYIADDMQEAVYIYDADGLERNNSSTPTSSGIKDQIPTVTNGTPVLAFWKRTYLSANSLVTSARNGNPSIPVKCLAVASPAADGSNCFGTDRFVYSLVVYYLIANNGATGTWSNSARIARFELKDGILDPNCVATCTLSAQRGDGAAAATPAAAADTRFYYVLPDNGFAKFDLGQAGSNLSSKLNIWKRAAGTSYIAAQQVPEILVDYIDDTSYHSNQEDKNEATGVLEIPIAANATTDPRNTDCESQAAATPGATGLGSQRVPGAFSTTSTNPSERLSSFYACVNSRLDRPVAKLFMRGNALARLTDSPNLRPLGQGSTFVPTATVRIFGRSILDPG
jgi:type II secretory pathway pseudopilin PulG